MDFELSEEEILVRDMAREFAQKELAPRAKQHVDAAHQPADGHLVRSFVAEPKLY